EAATGQSWQLAEPDRGTILYPRTPSVSPFRPFVHGRCKGLWRGPRKRAPFARPTADGAKTEASACESVRTPNKQAQSNASGNPGESRAPGLFASGGSAMCRWHYGRSARGRGGKIGCSPAVLL